MRRILFHLTLLVLLFALPACVSMGGGGSASGPRAKGPAQAANGQPNQKESPTPEDILIAQGRIDVDRTLGEQLAEGTAQHQEHGQVAFQVRGDPADSSVSRYVSAQGTITYTLEVRGPNGYMDGKATGTIKISGSLDPAPACRLRVEITEQWNPITVTGQMAGVPVFGQQSHPSISYNADFPLKNNARLNVGEIQSGVWQEKWWYLRRLALDPSTGCDPIDTATPKPNR